MRNVLSVDVEDYFQVEAFASRVSRQDWPGFESRVDRNVRRILEIFAQHQAKATFFVLGWVAEKYPHLVRQITEAGHEIGSHGFGHQRLHCLTPTQFKEDIYRTRRLLEDLSGQRVTCYRAPSFSIVKSTLWALDVLVEEGFTCDSSVFPTRHDFYGIPDAPRFPYCRRTTQGHSILEFPPSTMRIFGNNIGVAGGGYLRLTPYLFTRRAMRRIIEKEKQPVMVYFHPWEIDPGQPRISASLRSRLRHYTNLAGMARKIEWLLRDFRFTTLSEVCKDLAIRDSRFEIRQFEIRDSRFEIRC
jgi:polysaccharide deacetylase family protein (PEP-CTERM system associated)